MHEMRYPIEWKPEYASRAETFLQYAEVYKNAVDVLLRDLGNSVLQHDYQVLPVLFLFRHYVELQLKGLILYCGGEPKPEHDLSKLLGALKKLDPSADLRESPKIIEQLNKVDPRSDSFRYPEDTNMRRFFQEIDNEEFYDKITRLTSLETMIKATVGELENLEALYDIRNEQEHHLAEERLAGTGVAL